VTRIFLIAAPGSIRERIEELLYSSDLAVIRYGDDLGAFDEELADEAEVILIDASDAEVDDLLDELQDRSLLRESKVVLLVNRVSSAWLNRAIRAGVRGVLPSDSDADWFVSAVAAVAHGLVVIHPSKVQAARATDVSASGGQELIEPLTAREREVLEMLSQGFGNKEIAGRMKISEHTVKFHVASILAKLGAATRTEAVSVALRRGLVLL
jgi:two-component system, NarL family, response regulator YdfI